MGEELKPPRPNASRRTTRYAWLPLKALPRVVRQASSEWGDDNAPRLGAAIAFYSLLSLAPVIVIAVAAVGFGESVFATERASIIVAGRSWPEDCSMAGRITNMEKVEMSCIRGSVPLFFLTGLGVGIGLAVLLAPRSGAATRRLIGRKVEEGENWITDKAAAAQDCVRGHVEELRGRVKEVAEVIGRN